MARVSKIARGKISMARGIHCCSNFFISFVRPASVRCEEHVYMYTYPNAYRLYVKNSYYQITLRVIFFLQKSGAVRRVDWIFITGAPAWSQLGEYVTLN
jgi:hypothetical protein